MTNEDCVMDDKAKAYWRATLRLLGGVLAVWVLTSLGASIIFAGWLNKFSLGGYPLGFWFAQQGSIYIFISLICFYAWRMNKIDREFDVHEE